MNITNEEGQEACRRLNACGGGNGYQWPKQRNHWVIKALVTAMREPPWAPPVDEATLCYDGWKSAPQLPMPSHKGAITFALNWAKEREKQDG